MLLRVHSAPGFELAPAWLVSNGEDTVGPVPTHVLVRGYLEGRIPAGCLVQPSSGGDWRELEEVREIRALSLKELPSGPRASLRRPQETIRWLEDARDVSEALALSLHGACSVTQASIGVLYRVRAPIDLPVVSACYGDAELELGMVVPRRDPALALAREGDPTVLEPDATPAARAVAMRLCPDRVPASLAIVPIRAATELAGVLELARFDHPFRGTDVRSLISLMAATVARLEELTVLDL